MTVLQADPALRRRLMLAGVCWTGTMQFFIAQIVAQAFWPGYSMRDLDISFLGVTSCGPFTDPATGTTLEICSPMHGLIGSSFMATGLLISIGALLSLPVWPPTRRTTVAIWLLALAGLGTVASGVWPVDVNGALHGLGAVAYFILASVGLILIGSAMFTHRGFAVYTIATGTVSLAGFLLFAAQIDLGLGRGTMERIAGYPSIIWFIVSGILIIRAAERSRCRGDDARHSFEGRGIGGPAGTQNGTR